MDYATLRQQGNIAVLLVDNPPVNALSHHLRVAIVTLLDKAAADDKVKGVVLAASGRTFISGADITEFNTEKALASPSLGEICIKLENFAKPIVAAIHGAALGGGFEAAMCCHYRVALRDARVGLPEVHLGILPGAGGTVRLPRLIGPQAAMQAICSGKPIPAPQALELGALDAVFDTDLIKNAISFMEDKIASGEKAVAVRHRNEKITNIPASLLDAAIEQVAKKARGLQAPVKCAQAVRNAVTYDFDEALKREREIFLELVNSDQSKALRYMFFAQRDALKIPDIGKDVQPRSIKKIGIIGAGTMGGGIAMAMANGGYPVTILEVSSEALERGLQRIRQNYETSVARGSMSAEKMEQRYALLSGSTEYKDIGDCDLVIEAVFEEMSVKKAVFKTLEKYAKPGAILATNTSFLNIDEIAASTSRPQDVMGAHFFSPANIMKLLEIVRGKKTTPDAIQAVLNVAKKIGKIPVVVGVCFGFVGNRMLAVRGADNENLLLEGGTPRTIDKAFTDFGWPMGPFAMGDMAGLDIGWSIRKQLGETAPIDDVLCEQGRFGQKTGSGYYMYEAKDRTPKDDPKVQELIEKTSAQKGIIRRQIDADEIIERTLYPMINEGAKILEEKIASRASDIDVVWVFGYGFPLGYGGPMYYANQIGLEKILAGLEKWHKKTGRDIFKPAKLLRKLVAEKSNFAY